MPRTDLLSGIYASLVSETALLSLLGPVSATNRRLYRAYPQVAPLLTTIEPAREGWCVIREQSTQQALDREYSSAIHEVFVLSVLVCVTVPTLGQEVLEAIDDLYDWRVSQEREAQLGEWILLDSRRSQAVEEYNTTMKLYQVDARYHMRFVQVDFLA